jgi:peptide/nickel transport system substrate-binding protein
VQLIGPGGLGTAARTLEAYVVAGGSFAYGSYPDVDGLFREQASVLDRAKRAALLHRIQQLVHDQAMFAPMYELAFVNGVAGRVEESALGLIDGFAFSAPYEDVKLKAR